MDQNCLYLKKVDDFVIKRYLVTVVPYFIRLLSEKVEKIVKNKEIKDMLICPNSGSIKIYGDYIIVKFKQLMQ